MVAEIITIGDELLYGQILDTNAHWISSKLSEIGIKVSWRTTLGDVEKDILDSFAMSVSRADVIIITGGLGPTLDDLTKPCLATFFDCPMEINEEALKDVTRLFEEMGRELTPVNRLQASLPSCCESLSNQLGTAPGMWFEKNEKVLVALPGVPAEMKYLMARHVLPRLKERLNLPEIYHKVIKTAGIGESYLAEKLDDWCKSLPSYIKPAYLPGMAEVKVRLTAMGKEKTLLEKEVAQYIDQMKELAGRYIYGYDEDTLESVVGNLLKSNDLTLATAESCTGGHLAHLITSVPGSSAYFKGGIVAYDNDIKRNHLDVSEDTLIKHGAVSEETVLAMAQNIRSRFNTSIGVSTSGIAGPDGGTIEKPVGTVWIAFANDRGATARKLMLGNRDRAINIERASRAVLNFIRLQLS